jgi:hypothetical protein
MQSQGMNNAAIANGGVSLNSMHPQLNVDQPSEATNHGAAAGLSVMNAGGVEPSMSHFGGGMDAG